MMHKDTLVGPWGAVTGHLDFNRLKLLLTYPEQYRLRYGPGTTATFDAQESLDEELVASMWAGIPSWWARVDMPNRRTKAYELAAASATAMGLFPMLAGDLDKADAQVQLLNQLGYKKIRLQLYAREEQGHMFGDVVLTVDGIPALLKISSGDDIDRRAWVSDWLTQWQFAYWVSSSKALTDALILVVDPDAPGRVTKLKLLPGDLTHRGYSSFPFNDLGKIVTEKLAASSSAERTLSPPAFYKPVF